MTEATKKGSLWGTLKSIVAEEVPDAPAKANAPATPLSRASGIPSTPFVSVQMPPSVAAPDPQVLAKLEAKLAASLPPVYASFLEQYEQLRDVIPDEGMRFKAALKTSKATPDQLATAVDQLLQTMQNQATEFAKSFETNKANIIGQFQSSLKATEDLVDSREQQRKAIDEEIVSLRTKLQTDTERMQNEEHRLDGIRAGFTAAHTQVLDRLNQQKQHIASQKG